MHTPKQVIVVDSVPVTALGKPDKKAVRAQFWRARGVRSADDAASVRLLGTFRGVAAADTHARVEKQ